MTRFGHRRLAAALAALALGASTVHGEELTVSLPVAVSFSVTDISAPTSGSPEPATASFSDAALDAGKAVRLSVKADAADFSVPGGGGNAIPASKVSWTTSDAQNGTGSSGTLDSASYVQVFESTSDATSGSVDVSWTLAAPGAGVRAGDHNLAIRWKVESIVP